MPFSVSATESGLGQRLFHDATAIPSSPSGVKVRVCIVYYESGQCPYNNRCEHAHHFTELDRETQEKLLEAVPLDGIPRHFMEPSRSVFAYAAAARSGGGVRRCTGVSPFSPFSPFSPSTAGTAAGHCDKSSSSLASSGGSFLACSAPGSQRGSPLRGAMRQAEEPFCIRLPARCKYPHRATAGSYYDVLGVPRGAAQDEIIERYRQWQREGYRRAKQADQQRADAMDTIVVEARNVLGHPALRAEYDRTLPSVWGGGKDFTVRQAATAVSSVNSSYSYSADHTLSGPRSVNASYGMTKRATNEGVSPLTMLLDENSIW